MMNQNWAPPLEGPRDGTGGKDSRTPIGRPWGIGVQLASKDTGKGHKEEKDVKRVRAISFCSQTYNDEKGN